MLYELLLIMPNEQSTRMEDMSEAYVRALCAANGYSVSHSNHDNDGYDITVRCRGQVVPDSKIYSPSVDIQLKSSYAQIRENADGSITYALEVKNYKWLIDTSRFTPIILVVLHMYNDENRWIEHTKDWLKITKCAYWISLRGKPSTDNANTISINIPSTNILTKESLKEIMAKISKGEQL